MMGRYQFELAAEADDAELRRVLAATPMAGRISVTFQREPSYFDAAVVDGKFRQIIICRDHDAQRIVGFGSRSIRAMYVNGRPTPIGYLSMLRWAWPVCNCWATLRGRPKLPRPGDSFRYVVGALPVVADDDRDVFAALLDALLMRLVAGPCDYLLMGLHETDPLHSFVMAKSGICYGTRLYHACWEEGEALRQRLDERPPYLELVCL